MSTYQITFVNSERTAELTEAAAIEVLGAHWPNADDGGLPVEILDQLSDGESIETVDFALYRRML